MSKLSAIAFIITIMAPLPAVAYTQTDADACTSDAMRLCWNAIPDAIRITQCLFQNKQQLSTRLQQRVQSATWREGRAHHPDEGTHTSQSSYAQSGILNPHTRKYFRVGKTETCAGRWDPARRPGETYERNYGWGCPLGCNCHAGIRAGLLCLLGHGQCDRSAAPSRRPMACMEMPCQSPAGRCSSICVLEPAT